MGYTTKASQSQNVESDKKYMESELSEMTNNQIRQLASDRGYSLTATNKAGLISEFLLWQGQVVILEERLLQDLKIDFEDDCPEDAVLLLAIQRAIRSFKKKRNYPKSFSEEKILNDMEYCYDCIYDLALYKLNKRGNDFEQSHSENGASQSWGSESEIYLNHGVFPYPTMF